MTGRLNWDGPLPSRVGRFRPLSPSSCPPLRRRYLRLSDRTLNFHEDFVHSLVSLGFDIHVRDSCGRTLLYGTPVGRGFLLRRIFRVLICVGTVSRIYVYTSARIRGPLFSPRRGLWGRHKNGVGGHAVDCVRSLRPEASTRLLTCGPRVDGTYTFLLFSYVYFGGGGSGEVLYSPGKF